MMNPNNSQEKLDIQTKKNLAAVYQSLYDSIVDAKLAKGMTNGQSWHTALYDMGKLLKNQEQQNENPIAMEYLRQLFNTHKKVQSKKSMLANNRDEKLELTKESEKPKLLFSNEMLRIIIAYKQLLKMIKSKQNPDDNALAKYLSQIINNMNKTESYQNETPKNLEKLYFQRTLNNRFGNPLQK